MDQRQGRLKYEIPPVTEIDGPWKGVEVYGRMGRLLSEIGVFETLTDHYRDRGTGVTLIVCVTGRYSDTGFILS